LLRPSLSCALLTQSLNLAICAKLCDLTIKLLARKRSDSDHTMAIARARLSTRRLPSLTSWGAVCVMLMLQSNARKHVVFFYWKFAGPFRVRSDNVRTQQSSITATMDTLLSSPASVEVRLPTGSSTYSAVSQNLTKLHWLCLLLKQKTITKNMQDLQQTVRTKALLHLLSLANAQCTTAADEVFGVLRYE
jgi:hypothetical protein